MEKTAETVAREAMAETGLRQKALAGEMGLKARQAGIDLLNARNAA